MTTAAFLLVAIDENDRITVGSDGDVLFGSDPTSVWHSSLVTKTFELGGVPRSWPSTLPAQPWPSVGGTLKAMHYDRLPDFLPWMDSNIHRYGTEWCQGFYPTTSPELAALPNWVGSVRILVVRTIGWWRLGELDVTDQRDYVRRWPLTRYLFKEGEVAADYDNFDDALGYALSHTP